MTGIKEVTDEGNQKFLFASYWILQDFKLSDVGLKLMEAMENHCLKLHQNHSKATLDYVQCIGVELNPTTLAVSV